MVILFHLQLFCGNNLIGESLNEPLLGQFWSVSYYIVLFNYDLIITYE